MLGGSRRHCHAVFGLALAVAIGALGPRPAAAGEVEDTACRIVDAAAHSAHVPVGVLTRLVWTESRFRAGVTSPAGAQGIAQFMPGTAAQQGLANPFDPEQAIPKAASFLAELARQFGNIGLAAAAYNAGPNRVTAWLARSGTLPAETEVYVAAVTGRAAADWAAARSTPSSAAGASATDAAADSCSTVTAALRAGETAERGPVPVAPWGVQLSGNFSKPIALASFERARQRFAAVIGDLTPMIIGTVLRSRGTRPFYRVLLPASSFAEANHLCQAITARGGACVALRT